MKPERKEASANAPTLDDYFKAAHELATVVREAMTSERGVSRTRLKNALERFERVDYKAM